MRQRKYTTAQRDLIAELWPDKTLCRREIIARVNALGGHQLTEATFDSLRHHMGLNARRKGNFAIARDGVPDGRTEWTREQTDILFKEWAKGTLVSRFALLTGMTVIQVKSKRAYCALPARRKGSGKPELYAIAVYVSPEIDAKLKDVAKLLGLSRSGYIGKLISREIRA